MARFKRRRGNRPRRKSANKRITSYKMSRGGIRM